ncbi:hypothetical protein AKO1_003822 [Acrasis kona]|uniref:Transmembrane protein n=1 Tax=Acrasis kona TaxID=1008807 RepID=A0AAW2Z672_9EUKA
MNKLTNEQLSKNQPVINLLLTFLQNKNDDDQSSHTQWLGLMCILKSFQCTKNKKTMHLLSLNLTQITHSISLQNMNQNQQKITFQMIQFEFIQDSLLQIENEPLQIIFQYLSILLDTYSLLLSSLLKIDLMHLIQFAHYNNLLHFQNVVEWITCYQITNHLQLDLSSIYNFFMVCTNLTTEFDIEFLSNLKLLNLICRLNLFVTKI